MKTVHILPLATCASIMHAASAFVARPIPTTLASRHDYSVAPKAMYSRSNLKSSLEDIDEIPINEPSVFSTSSWRQRIIKAGTKAWERTDTLRAAGLCSTEENLLPMQAGFKTNVGLLVAAFLFKWYRARFITKIPVWDRQPQWNMVVTSPEQEKELNAYQCKKCGATIFIARHREWFFQGGNTECTNCGAKGKDNFVEVREEVVESIDDDYFDYESPLDFVSAAERRRLVKQAGGDENLAKKLAIEKAMKEDSEQVAIKPEASTEKDSVSEEVGSEPEKKTKKKKKDPPAPKKKEPVDIFDELDDL